MIIAGAGGHARELLGLFVEKGETENLCFYDDTVKNEGGKLYNEFAVLCNEEEIKRHFETDNRFVLGVGRPAVRKLLADKLVSLGGKLCSVISNRASIGTYNVKLGEGLNVLTHAVLTNDICVGEGTLIHIHASVHHNTVIGAYCELSPGCHILGNVVMGDYCSVGAGAVILPGLRIGSNVVIGAGSVVTKNIDDHTVVKGIPAK